MSEKQSTKTSHSFYLTFVPLPAHTLTVTWRRQQQGTTPLLWSPRKCNLELRRAYEAAASGTGSICIEGLVLHSLKLAQQRAGKWVPIRIRSKATFRTSSWDEWHNLARPDVLRHRHQTDHSDPLAPCCKGPGHTAAACCGSGGTCCRTRTTPPSCHQLRGMSPSRGHCPLGLSQTPGDPSLGEQTVLLRAKLSGLRALG